MSQPDPKLESLINGKAAGADSPPIREAVAAYILEHGDRIRAIARRKLTLNTRRVFDSEEILSSVLRRLDGMAARGTLRPRSEAELWALIEAIAKNTAVSRTRLIERMQNLVTEEGDYAYFLIRGLNACATDDEATLLVHRMLLSIPDASDRQITALILRGAAHRAIAGLLGITEEHSRQRWKRVREDLVARFKGGLLDE